MQTLSTYQYSLETGSRKFSCPSCRQKTFVKYLDLETRDYLPDEVGRCDRESRCGYHLTPKEHFARTGQPMHDKPFIDTTPIPEVPVNYMDISLVKRSMTGFEYSHFAKYIIDLFGENIGKGLLLKYFVGRSKADNGNANIFWRIDAQERVRTGKIMMYYPGTGKRNKEVHPTWVHNQMKPFNYAQCFFGEHLIGEHPSKDIAMCESEKTAIVASFFFPQYNWIATGGALGGCKWREYSVFKVFENRNVILFPDFGFANKEKKITCFAEWQDRANTIMERMKCKITVSRVLENNIHEDQRMNDYDLVLC